MLLNFLLKCGSINHQIVCSFPADEVKKKLPERHRLQTELRLILTTKLDRRKMVKHGDAMVKKSLSLDMDSSLSVIWV